MANFSVNCPFLFPNFAPTWWKKLGSQAATSSSMGTLVASNFGFGQTRKFRLFQSRFLATLLEDCYWKVVLKKLLQNIILKKFCLTTNSAQNFIAKFSVSCSLFLLFSFCASGKISVAKPQRVLRAKRYKLVAENFFSEKFSAHWSLLIGINNQKVYGKWNILLLQESSLVMEKSLGSTSL